MKVLDKRVVEKKLGMNSDSYTMSVCNSCSCGCSSGGYACNSTCKGCKDKGENISKAKAVYKK